MDLLEKNILTYQQNFTSPKVVQEISKQEALDLFGETIQAQMKNQLDT